MRFIALTALLIPLCQGATLRVGPTREFSSPCQAIAAASAGDIIEIDPVETYSHPSCSIQTPLLTIRSSGTRRALIHSGVRNGTFSPATATAVWLVRSAAQRLTLEGLEFYDTRLQTRNGAAVRLEDGVSLVIRDCLFRNNDSALVTGDSAGQDHLIEHSIFELNGSMAANGIDVGPAGRLVFQGNYLMRGNAGHMISSRAAQSFILYNRISEETFGFGDLEVDLPAGGRAFLIGNTIQQDESSRDRGMVGFLRTTAPAPGSVQELYVINNTFSNLAKTGTFIQIGAAMRGNVFVRNNIFHGPGAAVEQDGGPPGSTVALANNFAGDPMFVDLERHNYQLKAGSPAIDAGAPAGSAQTVSLTPDRHYSHQACMTGRVSRGPIDIGAYEFNGDTGQLTGLARCIVAPVIPPGAAPRVTNGASFEADRVAPGSIASLFGAGFSELTLQPSAAPLPTILGPVSVTVNAIRAPLFFVSLNQINIQIPTGMDTGDADVVVNIAGQPPRMPARVRLRPAAPGIFFHSGNRAVAQNQDFTLNTPDNGAPPGGVVIVYMTGQGALSRFLQSGAAALSFPLSEATLPSSATIGGRPAAIHFLGMTPGLVGVLQANLEIPDLPPGDHPVVVTIDGVASNSAVIAVR
jgi:uncharacterized protein (TIGR03437 family)